MLIGNIGSGRAAMGEMNGFCRATWTLGVRTLHSMRQDPVFAFDPGEHALGPICKAVRFVGVEQVLA
jgi:hypothetical protein